MNFTEKEHDYIKTESESDEGHVDTIKGYYNECLEESNLGCDPGIDVAG